MENTGKGLGSKVRAQVHNANGQVTEQIEVSDSLFMASPNPDLVHQTLVRQRANARQGTVATKPHKQKHTGRARAGSRRSPIWRGGGTVFGPQPRSYRQSLPKKMRRQAIRCMLSSKATEGWLILLDQFPDARLKTRMMLETLSSLGINSSVLIATGNPELQVVLASRNIPRTKTIPARLLNVGDLVSHRYLLMTVDAVRQAEQLWATEDTAKQEVS